MKPQPRSGDHIILRGNVWHYWRMVPPECRPTYGKSVESKSLNTANRTEALRSSKAHDVDFDRRIRDIRSVNDPEKVGTKFAEQLLLRERFSLFEDPYRSIREGIAHAFSTPETRAKAEQYAFQEIKNHRARIAVAKNLGREIAKIMAEIAPDRLEPYSTSILTLARQIATPNNAVKASANEPKTLEWAYRKWLAVREEGTETVGAARLYLDGFVAHSRLVMLGDVRRHHLVEWRDTFQKADPPLAENSINKRLNLVRAIIRVGWREAEFPQFDLADITLPVPEENDRRALNRSEILAILQALASEPLWARWTFVIALTTSTRLSEILAARIGCFNHETGFIESRRDAVKGRRGRRKAHAMPLLDYLREPFLRYVIGRPSDDFLLADAPRAANTKLPAGHEASKWFGRFFRRNKLEVCFHETRDTWIHHARHSSTKRDLWEIISGHSEKCMSDRYGGEDPGVLLGVNEQVCKFLTKDAEVRNAMPRLVG
jgi:hypothetical protein